MIYYFLVAALVDDTESINNRVESQDTIFV